MNNKIKFSKKESYNVGDLVELSDNFYNAFKFRVCKIQGVITETRSYFGKEFQLPVAYKVWNSIDVAPSSILHAIEDDDS